jgi:hypothetical protein
MGKQCSVIVDEVAIRAIRHRLHELANVFTGVMLAGGLLAQHLEGGSLGNYAADICEGSERGAALVWEIRNQLLSAGGGLEAAQKPSAIVEEPGEQAIS